MASRTSRRASRHHAEPLPRGQHARSCMPGPRPSKDLPDWLPAAFGSAESVYNGAWWTLNLLGLGGPSSARADPGQRRPGRRVADTIPDRVGYPAQNGSAARASCGGRASLRCRSATPPCRALTGRNCPAIPRRPPYGPAARSLRRQVPAFANWAPVAAQTHVADDAAREPHGRHASRVTGLPTPRACPG